MQSSSKVVEIKISFETSGMERLYHTSRSRRRAAKSELPKPIDKVICQLLTKKSRLTERQQRKKIPIHRSFDIFQRIIVVVSLLDGPFFLWYFFVVLLMPTFFLLLLLVPFFFTAPYCYWWLVRQHWPPSKGPERLALLGLRMFVHRQSPDVGYFPSKIGQICQDRQ